MDLLTTIGFIMTIGIIVNIYRGLAAVNAAGVIVSMVFSIVLLPSLMRLVHERRSPPPATRADLLTETAR